MKRFKKGGIHPPDQKNTGQSPYETGQIPSRVVLPLSQHLGAPAKPVVEKGQAVIPYQLIGRQDGFISSNIHTPVPGTVEDVKEMPSPLGPLPSVVIQVGGRFDQTAQMEGLDWKNTEKERLLERIKEAGICGLGGATFPTYVKLSPPKEKPIHTLIINGAECEPYLTCDHRLMLECDKAVFEGIAIVQKLLGAQQAYLGIEKNKPDALALFSKQHKAPWFQAVPVRTRYPQGAEKQLIQAITGKQVPPGGLPMDVGCVVLNVGTCHAIQQAVVQGKPLVERGITLAGDCVKRPGNVMAKIGTPFKTLIEQAGGLVQPPKKIIVGGPMMGTAVPSLELPIVKGCSGILLFSEKTLFTYKNLPCIRCGRCVSVCPMGLRTAEICLSAEFQNYPQAKAQGLMDCIECGSCSYRCPQFRPLVQYVKNAKAYLKRNQKG